jgi:hypothetical protein
MRPSRPSTSRRRRSARTAPATASALRLGREALTDLQGQLDDLLAWLANPAGGLDARAPDRLAATAQRAGRALASLGEPRPLTAQRL